MQFTAMDPLFSLSKLFGPCLYLGIPILILLKSDMNCLTTGPLIDGGGEFCPDQPLSQIGINFFFFLIGR